MRDEPWLAGWLTRIMSADKSLAFDVGANEGTWTEELSRLFRSVVSFEPDVRCTPPPGFAYDRRAISHTTGSGSLYQRDSALQSSLLPVHPIGDTWRSVSVIEKLPIQCLTFDDAARQYGEPGFVKMDIEGGEVLALAGATLPCFSRCHWLIELHNTFDGVVGQLKRLGFTSVTTIEHPNQDAAEGHKWLYASQ